MSPAFHVLLAAQRRTNMTSSVLLELVNVEDHAGTFLNFFPYLEWLQYYFDVKLSHPRHTACRSIVCKTAISRPLAWGQTRACAEMINQWVRLRLGHLPLCWPLPERERGTRRVKELLFNGLPIPVILQSEQTTRNNYGIINGVKGKRVCLVQATNYRRPNHGTQYEWNSNDRNPVVYGEHHPRRSNGEFFPPSRNSNVVQFFFFYGCRVQRRLGPLVRWSR